MKLDIEKYLPHLDGLNVSRQRKQEIIDTVWNMMQLSVDKAFGIHPVQTARQQTRKNISEIGRRRLESKGKKNKRCFNHASKPIGEERTAE